MRPAVPFLVCAALLAGGCSHVTIGSDGVSAGGRASISSDRTRAVLLLGFLAAASYGSEPSEPEPELAPDRVITEVDCSKPVDFTAGNLRCK